MPVTISLAKVPVGGRARVLSIGGEASLQQRLLELGLVPGVELKLVRLAPLGDPMEIQLLGYNLSVRKADAALVSVEAL